MESSQIRHETVTSGEGYEDPACNRLRQGTLKAQKIGHSIIDEPIVVTSDLKHEEDTQAGNLQQH